MPDVQSTDFRIYCICGQKMKVSRKMHGLPGKCIACRQKIRIPTSEEVPGDTNEIYLKDHPELLRGPPRSEADAKERKAQHALDSVRKPVDDDSTPITELDLEGGLTPAEKARAVAEGGEMLPLDTLDALQKLCSIEYKLKRQLATLEDFGHDDDVLRADVEGQLAGVHQHRRNVDDHLHQYLMEVAIELANTHERIGQTRLDARIGKLSFAEYQDSAYRLRARRDRLERRQQNLRGWLTITNPFGAGGLLDLSMSDVPEDGFKVTLPVEQNEKESLLQSHVAGLRMALTRRAQADRSVDEAEKIAAEDDETAMNTARIEAQWRQRLARADVTYYLGRLERMKKDYESDLDTIKSQLEAARGRMKLNEIDRSGYDDIERVLQRAKTDVTRAQNLVARALTANTSEDVPLPSGTFLNRIGVKAKIVRPSNTALSWASVVALCVGIFFPVLDETSLVGAFLDFQETSGFAAWFFVLPIAIAVAVASTVRVSKESERGLLLLVVWCIALIGAVYGVFQGMNSLDPMAEQFRDGGSWLMRSGVWILGLGLAGIAAATVLTLWAVQSLRLLALSVLLLGTLIAGLIPSDFGGLIAPSPAIDVNLTESAEDPETAGSVIITNLGKRALNLLSRPSGARSSYLLVMEKRVGVNSWSEVNVPATADLPAEGHTVHSNESYPVPFRVGFGEYRILLLSSALGTEISKTFAIDKRVVVERAPEPDAPVEPVPDPILESTDAIDSSAVAPEAEASVEGEAPELAAVVQSNAVRVELRGVMTGAENARRFRFVRYFPDATEDQVTLGLGDLLYGDWEVSEYNSAFRTVTLEREGRLHILRYRKVIEIPE